MNTKNKGFDTKSYIQVILTMFTEAAVTPIYQNFNFCFSGCRTRCPTLVAGQETGYIYTRIGNPTIGKRLGKQTLAAFENGKRQGGVGTRGIGSRANLGARNFGSRGK